MNRYKILESRVWARIVRKKSKVFIREDFADLGGYDQTGRALLKLVRQNKLIRLGYGIYAKASVSRLTGEVIPAAPLPVLAKEALQRLGIKIFPTKAEQDYQQGRSTQVPTGRLIGTRSRINRKIGYKDATVYYERV